MKKDALSRSIQSALETRATKRQPTDLDTAQEAGDAKTSLEANLSCMPDPYS